MSYIGNNLQVAYPSYRNIDDISGSFDGVTTSFPLTVGGSAPVPAPLSSNQCLISVGGVVQRPDDSGTEGFLLSGGNIVFSAAPTGGDDFFGVILAGADYVNVGVNFPSGTASTPSITFDTDLDTGLFNPGANELAVATAGTSRLVVDSSGNVNVDAGGAYYDATNNRLGIGTTSPASLLSVDKGNVTNRGQWSDCGVALHNPTNVGAYSQIGFGYTPSQTYASAYIGYLSTNQGASGYGDIVFGTRSVNTDSQPSERARIDSSGRLLVGTASTSAVCTALLQNRSDNGGPGTLYLSTTTTAPTSAEAFGRIIWTDSGHSPAVQIEGGRDGGTWTSGASQPSKLVFSVTADGSASPSEAMRINNAGELLVGYTSDNGAYKLQVNSQIFATSAIIATSDGRYKENVAALDGCVDLVKALRPVSFDWKAQEPVTRVDEDGETVVVREAHNFPDGKQVGFIAQEVEEVLADKPWLGSVIKQNVRPAVTDADGNELAPEEEFLGIAEGNLVAVLTSALKDAIGRIESLEAEVAALKA